MRSWHLVVVGTIVCALAGAAALGRHGAAGKPAKTAATPVKPPPPLAAGSPKWDAKKQGLAGAAGNGKTASKRDDHTASRAPARKGEANGAPCDFDSECASGRCNFNTCVSGDSSNKALGNGM